MPIEIKELHITARVAPLDKPQSTAMSQADIAKLKQSIIRDTTREVLKQIEKRSER